MENNQIKQHNKYVTLGEFLKPISYIVFVFLFELLNLIFTSNSIMYGFWDIIIPKYFGFDLAFSIIIAAIICILNRKRRWIGNLIFYFFISLQLILNITNSIIYRAQGTIFTLDMFVVTDAGLKAFEWGFVNWWAIASNFALLFLSIGCILILDLKMHKKILRSGFFTKITSVLASTIFILGGIGIYTTQVFTMKHDDYEILWSSLTFKTYAMKKFGTFGFYSKNLYNEICKPTIGESLDSIVKATTGDIAETNEFATLYGDNLIVVMLESFDWFAIDPYNTPFIYSLMNDSVVLTNYESNNKTNVSEDIAMLGFMPDIVTLSNLQADDIIVHYSLGNMFQRLGYSSNYFHSYTSSFYDRNLSYKNLGFDNLHFIEDVTIESKTTNWNDWSKEVDVFNAFSDKMIPTDGSKFFSFYLTVGTHGDYDYNNSRFEEYKTIYDTNIENMKGYFDEQGYVFPTNKTVQNQLRTFKSEAIDTDRMLKNLFAKLNTDLGDGRKLIDNTTVLLFADHNCYYHELCYKIKNTDLSDYKNLKSYNVPLILYSKKIVPKQISDFTSTFDIYPTISELFGLPYNKYLAGGFNFLEPYAEEKVYYSQLTGFYSPLFYSQNIFDITSLTNNSTNDQKESFKNYCIEIYKKQTNINKLFNSHIKAAELIS
ncbi:MAG: sulfatase-like hydrolase/transferase [Clostridia bacterium]|nr:sulfatase-like hydrolase/transferase [Clostridia bacterium]